MGGGVGSGGGSGRVGGQSGCEQRIEFFEKIYQKKIGAITQKICFFFIFHQIFYSSSPIS